MMFPKPEVAKKKSGQIKRESTRHAKAERSRTTLTGGKCFFTGRTDDLTKHELFGGRNRGKSIEHGMVIDVIFPIHCMIEDNELLKLILKKWGQKQFERLHPDKDFMSEFGKNYMAVKMEGEIHGELLQILEKKGYTMGDFEEE